MQTSSFLSEVILDRTYTIEALSEESRTSLTKDSNLTTLLQTSEASLGEPVENYRPPVKHSGEHSKSSRRKRRNAGDSDYELSQQSGLQESQSSGFSEHFESYILRQEPGSRSSRDDLEQSSLDTAVEKLPSNKKKA